MCMVGLVKKTLEWQQISSISSSENNSKCLEFNGFFTIVICHVILLCQNSLSSFERLFTLTMEYRQFNITNQYLVVASQTLPIGEKKRCFVRDLEHSRVAENTATFTAVITSKSSICVQNMV